MSAATSQDRRGAGTHHLDGTGPVDLVVEVGSGSVTVHTVGSDATTVEVSPGDGSPRALDQAAATAVRRFGRRVEVRVPRSGGFLGRDGRVDVRVTVPVGSTADLSSRSGAIRTGDGLADVTAASATGDVALGAVTGHVRVSTATGDVTVAGAGSAAVRSASGIVRLGEVPGGVEVSTASGDVHADAADGDTLVSSGSGDVRLGRSSAEVVVSTASGDVVLGGARSGDVQVKTASGDVEVVVPAGTDVLLDCSSVSGRLRSGLHATDGPAEGHARLHLRVRTVSGDVDVRRP